MIKSLIFFLLRCALGYVLISFIFMATTSSSNLLPQDLAAAGGSRVYNFFYLGTMVAWIAGVVLAIGHFAKMSSPKSAQWFAWAPVYLPPVYAGLSYVWLVYLSGAQI